MKLAQKLEKQLEESTLFKDYDQKMGLEACKGITVVEDRSIPTAANLEIAESDITSHVLRGFKRLLILIYL